jgi:ABC-type dipeptide/oligopeptide/nickel transport system permease component/ABC-type transport system substrate-binding protein
LLLAFAYLTAPDLPEVIPYTDQEAAKAAREARDVTIDVDHPLVLYRQVDYSEGESAAWYPKGESPVLAKLVKEGKLPPVAERVGPEPAVMEGVDGIGNYGGTWQRADEITLVSGGLGAETFYRFSPHGLPLVPHLAKNVEISPDATVYTVHMRKGIRWSDGEPCTADDVMYMWEDEQCVELLWPGGPHEQFRINGLPCDMEKIDDYTVKIIWPEPNGAFLAINGRSVMPEHYKRKYHPLLGDDELIERHMKARGYTTRESLYRADIRPYNNPEHPRMWPWLYRRHRSAPPQRAVRNPYYYVVDTEGNQLPYIDTVLFKEMSERIMAIACANGHATMQSNQLEFKDYTLLMDNREKYGYEVYHWYPARRSNYAIVPALTRRVEPDKPQTRWKAQLLADVRFRKALSLAINRERIIKADFDGLTEPANDVSGRGSPFYDEYALKVHTEYDPARANALLDELGLTGRDGEGYRTFPDGSRMVFFLDYTQVTGLGSGEFVLEDWGEVGVHVIGRQQDGALYSQQWRANLHDMSVLAHGHFYPVVAQPLPLYSSNPYLMWHKGGGMREGHKVAADYAIAPPRGSAVRKAFDLYNQGVSAASFDEQVKAFRAYNRLKAEQQWSINICTPTPVLAVVKNGLKNVPRTVVAGGRIAAPANAGSETFYFERPRSTREGQAELVKDILEPTLPPRWPTDDVPRTEDARAAAAAPEAPQDDDEEGYLTMIGHAAMTALKWGLILGGLALVLLVSIRRPYIGRRILIMIPTLWIVSVVVFVIVQIPPGNFLDTEVARLQQHGTSQVHQEYLDSLKEMFWLDEPMWVRYVNWLGLRWFLSFDGKDTGLLQGNMGRSMQQNLRPVNQLVGDRLVLTFLISLGTILFTYAMSLPIGIYSAVRQYGATDYVLMFVGFIGLSVPNFLLALLLMYASSEWFDAEVTGLFSPAYAAQVGWSWGKFVDLLKHIWIPIVVAGTAGTAGGIRTMRANLLDELRKPYVVAAKARGVRPIKLLLKYPVRLALNPFISGIGGILPALVSGGAIVAIVLSLSTVGPLMLEALMTQDVYLAGSMLLFLSMLAVIGTLMSDLLLLVLDPRIRFESGTR